MSLLPSELLRGKKKEGKMSIGWSLMKEREKVQVDSKGKCGQRAKRAEKNLWTHIPPRLFIEMEREKCLLGSVSFHSDTLSLFSPL